jgi:hypothetical protein
MALDEVTSESPSVAAARLLQIIEARFGEGLSSVRAPSARGPAADREALRTAYLDLLKLTLCDLAAPRTTSVQRTLDGHVMSRELEGDQLRFRTAGMDWPLHGLTMVGLARLDDLQACVESVIADGVPGEFIEAGTWRGGASMLMRATLDSLGAHDRHLYVADSFQGFPAKEKDPAGGYDLEVDLAAVDFLAIPVDEVRANFARLGLEHDVTFVPGFFQDTLLGMGDHRWAIARLDGDTYDATRFSLDALYPNLEIGGYLVIDDYVQIDQCREAVDDFRREHGITEPLVEVDWSGARWRRETSAGPAAVPAAGANEGTAAAPLRAVERGARDRVPAIEEVDLRHEHEVLKGRLAAAEAEIARLTGSPLAGAQTWLRRRLRGGA